jgi:carboxyl-terminal processing protease
MTRARRLWGLVLVAWAVPLAGQQLDPVARARLAAGMWSEARYSSPDWESVRADWDSAFTAVLSTTAARQTDLAYFRRLRRFLAILNDGGATIVPPAAVANRLARPPIALRGVERRPFLVDYLETDEMRVARPQRDAEIIAVQGIPAAQWIHDSILPEIPASTDAARWERAIAHMLEGPSGTAVHLELKLPGGERRGASVTRSVSLNTRWPLAAPALQVDTLPDGVVWVRLSSFADGNVARAFDRAFPRWDGVRGVILDLRDHTGDGDRETGYAILGRLVTQPLITSAWRTPQYRAAYRGDDNPDLAGAWLRMPPETLPPRQDLPAFTGPVAVLASCRTAAAAEALLVAFRNAGRGPIVGQRSAGSAGQVAEFRLWKGWSVRLTVTRDEFPDGAAINGTGIAPELPVDEKVADFLAGRDAVLERARAYITERSLQH